MDEDLVVKIKEDFVQCLKNELRVKMQAFQTVQVKAEPECNFELEEVKAGNGDLLLTIEKTEENLDQTEIAVGLQLKAGEFICVDDVKERERMQGKMEAYMGMQEKGVAVKRGGGVKKPWKYEEELASKEASQLSNMKTIDTLSPVPVIAATEGRDDMAVGNNTDCSPTGAAVPSDVELPKCDKCGKMFARESTLLTHLRTHDGDMPYQCDICQARFADWSTELIPHLRMHGSSTNAYPCHVCGEEYMSRSCLKKHLRSHEGVEVSDSDGDLFEVKHHRRYKCERCDRVFTTRKSRLRHARESHVMERRFTCNLCQRSYFSKGQLATHMRWHSVERPYKCSSCSLSFQVKGSLRDHQRVHTRECIYQCHICGIMFLHPNGLRRHLRFHSQVKQFQCDVCKRTFTLKTTLTKHIVRTHSHLYGLDKG